MPSNKKRDAVGGDWAFRPVAVGSWPDKRGPGVDSKVLWDTKASKFSILRSEERGGKLCNLLRQKKGRVDLVWVSRHRRLTGRAWSKGQGMLHGRSTRKQNCWSSL